jgi:hypothetical protein
LAFLQSDFSVGEQRVHGIGGDFIAMEAKESFIGSFAGQLLFYFSPYPHPNLYFSLLVCKSLPRSLPLTKFISGTLINLNKQNVL